MKDKKHPILGIVCIALLVLMVINIPLGIIPRTNPSAVQTDLASEMMEFTHNASHNTPELSTSKAQNFDHSHSWNGVKSGNALEEVLENTGEYVNGTGTSFAITNSEYLNITLTSSEPVQVLLDSIPRMVNYIIEGTNTANTSILTFTGFEPNALYFRYQDGYLIENFTTDSTGSYSYTQDLSQKHRIYIQEETSTITITSDGELINPNNAPISIHEVPSIPFPKYEVEFKGNIYESIRVEAYNVGIDGKGYTLLGSGSDIGIYLSYSIWSSIKNVTIQGWSTGIRIHWNGWNEIFGNTITTNNEEGILVRGATDNYIYDNTITNNQAGITLSLANDNQISDNTLDNGDDIKLEDSSHNTISGNSIQLVSSINFWNGIILLGSSTGNTISNNDIQSQRTGIHLYNSPNNNFISDNTLEGNTNGISLYNSSNNDISGNIINYNTYGIQLAGSSNNDISGNTINYNLDGIYLYNSSSNPISGNTITANTRDGIHLDGVQYNHDGIRFNGVTGIRISRNAITNNNDYGLLLSGSSGNRIEENTFAGNRDAIGLQSSSKDNTILGNTITDNHWYGIELDESADNIISDNTITANWEVGVWLKQSSRNIISGNTINSNGDGIVFEDSSRNIISENNVSTNLYGINLDAVSSNNHIAGNNITSNVYGLILNSEGNFINHNNFIDNSETPSSYDKINDWYHPDLLEGNYWSNYPGVDDGSGTDKHAIAGDGIGDTEIPWPWAGYDYYPFIDPIRLRQLEISEDFTFTENVYEPIIVTADNIVIDGNGYILQGAGYRNGFDISNRHGVIIKNVTITGWAYGIHLDGSSGTHIENNTITDNNLDGIVLERSAGNVIAGNIITSNTRDGISLKQSSDNHIIGNIIDANIWNGISLGESSGNHIEVNTMIANRDGISLWQCSNDHIYSNTITTNTRDGISLWQCSGDCIYKNSIIDNMEHGIYIDTSSNIWVYYNHFIGNRVQAGDTHPANNDWYHLDNLEGNYWGDYPGFDDGSGIDKHALAYDGIGDTDLPWPAPDYDEYPLTLNIAKIAEPMNNSIFSTGENIKFTGIGKDTGGDIIPEANYVWESNLDGYIGRGSSIERTNVSVGHHVIILTVTDTHRYVGRDWVTIHVGPDFLIFPQDINWTAGLAGTFDIRANITNIGATHTGEIKVHFYDKGDARTLIGIQTIIDLPRNEEKPAILTATWYPKGLHMVHVYIDYNEEIAELDESNNWAERGTFGHEPMIEVVDSRFGVWRGTGSVGRFIVGTDLNIENTFTVSVSDKDLDVARVDIKLNGNPQEVSTDDPELLHSVWKCVIQTSDLDQPPGENILAITAIDAKDIHSETRSITIETLDFPDWLKLLAPTIKWESEDQIYRINFDIPFTGIPEISDILDEDLNLDYQLPNDVPWFGGKHIKASSKRHCIIEAGLDGSAHATIEVGDVFDFLGIEDQDFSGTGSLELDEHLNFASLTIGPISCDFPVFSYGKTIEVTDPWFGEEITVGLGVGITGTLKFTMHIREEAGAPKLSYISFDISLTGTGGYGQPFNFIFWGGTVTVSAYAELNAYFYFDFGAQDWGISLSGEVGTNLIRACGWVLNVLLEQEPLACLTLEPFSYPFEPVSWPLSKALSSNRLAALSATDEANFPLVYLRPQVAADANGNAMKLWIRSRDDGVNIYSDIGYALWDGTTWGPAGYISYDTHADFDPALIYDANGNVIAVWSRILNVPGLVPSDDPVSLLETQEIVYSVWDHSTEMWSPPEPITADAVADGRAVVTTGPDNTILAVWMGFADSDYSAPIDTDLYYAVWDGTQWTPKTPLTSTTAMDYSVSLAHDSTGNVLACWLKDLDGIPTTSEDTELRYALWDGTSWSPSDIVTDLPESKQSPSVAFDQQDNALVTWVGGNETFTRLYATSRDKTTGAWSAPEIVREDNFFIFSPSIQVAPDNIAMVTWRGFEDEATEPDTRSEPYFDGEICYATKNLSRADAEWSGIKYLTQDNETDWMASSVIVPGHSNDLLLVWDKADENEEVESLVHPMYPDLTLNSSDITFSNDFPKEEESIDITARIHNIGDIDAEYVQIVFYDGDPQDGGILISDAQIAYLSYDSIEEVQIPWDVEPGIHDIYVEIDPSDPDDDIKELNETNNLAYKTIGILPDFSISSADISFSPSEPNVDAPVDIFATIHNQGGTSADSIPVYFYSNATLIGIYTIPSLDAESSESAPMDWKAIAGYNNISVEIDPTNEISEWNETNNLAFTILSILPDLNVTGFSLSENEIESGGYITLTAVIQNNGAADASEIQVEFFDGNPYISGTLINPEPVTIDVLPRNGIETVSIIDWDPSPGIHQVFIIVDRANRIAESNELNNILYDGLVVRTLADLSLSEEDITIEVGSIQISTLVRNLGAAGATGVVVHLYDNNPTTDGILLDSQTIPYIAAKGTGTAHLRLVAPPKTGILYFIINPEDTIPETDKTNNHVETRLELIDRPPSTTHSLTGTPGLDEWYVSDVTVTLTATDDYTGVAETAYRVDGGIWTPYTDPFTHTTEGSATISYNSTDNSGNVEPTKIVTIKIDKTPPETLINLTGTQDPGGWFVSDVLVNLTATDAHSGVATTEYRMNDALWTPYLDVFSITADGLTTLSYRSTDVAGNVEASKTKLIEIQRPSPPPISLFSDVLLLLPVAVLLGTLVVLQGRKKLRMKNE